MGHRVARAIAGERESLLDSLPESGAEEPPSEGWQSSMGEGSLSLEDLKTLLWEKAGIVRTASLVSAGKAQILSALASGKTGEILPQDALLHNALNLARLLFEDLETAPRVGSNYFLEDQTVEKAGTVSGPDSGS